MVIVGVLLVLLGVFGVVIPFVGPLFDFGMGPEPAWTVTTARLVRHVVPGVAVILGGLMLLFPGARASRALGVSLALLGGIWLTVAPVVLGRIPEGMPALIDVLRPLAYHYGTGLLITAALGAFALGRLSGRRSKEQTKG